jgi:hypothetical protein
MVAVDAAHPVPDTGGDTVIIYISPPIFAENGGRQEGGQ